MIVLASDTGLITRSENKLEFKHLCLWKQRGVRQQNACQEAAVFDYKGISNPVSLSHFLNISV